MQLRDLWSLTAALTALAGLAVAVGGWARLGTGRAVLTASARAVLQLLGIGLVIGVIFRTPVLAPLYIMVMLAAAAGTCGRRLHRAGRPAMVVPFAALGIGAGAGLSAGVVLVCGALPFTSRSAVPFAAQLIGGAMTAATLSGQRLLDDVSTGWNEVEGWLALGATPAQALREPARRSAGRALVPALDQTRNVGLVVLPGAFVGLLLAGASPLEAGRVQLLVLVGLLAAQTVAAVTVTRLLAVRITRRPVAG